MTCSNVVNFEVGERYFCCLQLANGEIDIVPCSAGEMTDQVLLERAPAMALVVDPDRYVKTLYTVTKVADTEKQVFMLSEMSRNGQMTNKLT